MISMVYTDAVLFLLTTQVWTNYCVVSKGRKMNESIVWNSYLFGFCLFLSLCEQYLVFYLCKICECFFFPLFYLQWHDLYFINVLCFLELRLKRFLIVFFFFLSLWGGNRVKGFLNIKNIEQMVKTKWTIKKNVNN